MPTDLEVVDMAAAFQGNTHSNTHSPKIETKADCKYKFVGCERKSWHTHGKFGQNTMWRTQNETSQLEEQKWGRNTLKWESSAVRKKPRKTHQKDGILLVANKRYSRPDRCLSNT